MISTFAGQPTVDGDVLVKYTYFGDANLDGVVNSADYLQIDNGFNSSKLPPSPSPAGKTAISITMAPSTATITR